MSRYDKPFLKWVGGKQRSLERILESLPPGKRFVEPFAGSGVVWLNAGFQTNVVCDLNPDLILTFQMLAKYQEKFIRACKSLFNEANNSQSAYLFLRDRFNKASGEDRAPLFVYLNRHCYNGLVRYNKAGLFNVPFGRYSHPSLPEDEMRAFIRKCGTTKVVFHTQSFEQTFAMVVPGDVVYCDPPYASVAEQLKSFASYMGTRFTMSDHQRLRDLAQSAGVPVLISNHHTPETEKLYSGAAYLRADNVRRSVSAQVSRRAPASEILALYMPQSSLEHHVEQIS